VNDRVRLGVAGAGRWGRNIIHTAAKLGVLAAVCDDDERAIEAIRTAHSGVALFRDFDEMIACAPLDAVAVAAPAQLHAPLALKAIDAGLDGVFIEKPLALSVVDADTIVDAARRRGAVLAVGHLMLYHPAIRVMLDAIAHGEIGHVRHFRSRRLGWGTLRSHEDVWWSFAPHDVSVMLAVMGEEPTGGYSHASAFVRPHISDFTYTDFSFSGGRTAHVEVAWIDPLRSARIDVFGSEGVLSLSDREGAPALTLWPCGDRLGARGEPELWRAESRNLPFSTEEPLAIELRSFCEAVRGGPPPLTDGQQALAVVRALALAQITAAIEAMHL
jgi:UDP-2-acetamido-3-amino-2,3-dideoxy-glucuronate N-acetyltransferase